MSSSTLGRGIVGRALLLLSIVGLAGCTIAYSVAIPNTAHSMAGIDGALEATASPQLSIYLCLEAVGFRQVSLPPALADRQDRPSYDSYWAADHIEVTVYQSAAEWRIDIGKPWGWSAEMGSSGAANRIQWCLAGRGVTVEIRQHKYLDWS